MIGMRLVGASINRINPNGTRETIFQTSVEDEARLREIADESYLPQKGVIDLELNPSTGVYEVKRRKELK